MLLLRVVLFTLYLTYSVNMKNNQKGFGLLEGFIIVCVVGLISASVFYFYRALNKNRATKNSTSGNTSTIAPTAATQEKINYKQATLADNYYYIKEWAVKIPYSDNIKGLEYNIKDEGENGSSALFRTDTLNKINTCRTNSFKIRRGAANDVFPKEAGDSKTTFKQYYDELIAARASSNEPLAYPIIYGSGVVVGGYHYMQWGSEKTMHCTSPDTSTAQSEDKETLALDNIAKALSSLSAE